MCNQQAHIDALRQEHQELVQLFMHEDSLAWQLNLAFLATNGAIFTGVLFSLDLFKQSNTPEPKAYLLFLSGLVLNLLMFFVFQRSKIHWSSRLLRAYTVEDELQKLGAPIETFSTAERLIRAGQVLDKSSTRNLRWYEKIEVLKLRWWPLVLALVWASCIIWLAKGRPWI